VIRELFAENGPFEIPPEAGTVPEATRPIVVRVCPGVVGVRASLVKGVEVVEIGLPELADYLHFRPFDDVTVQPNAVSLVLREIISRRGVSRLRFSQPELWPCIRKALASTSAETFFGTHQIARREFRPAFEAIGCEPGAHWSAWLRGHAKVHA